MSEKIAHRATAVSAVIAAIVLVISIYKFWSDSNKEKVEDWQKVAVYEYILKRKSVGFDNIKIGYIAEAQQINAFNIPQDKIQDDALRKVLLELQESKLIMLNDELLYLPVLAYKRKDPSKYMTQMIELLQNQQKYNDLFPEVRIKILDFVNNDCGKYTQDALYRQVSSQIKIEEPLFYSMLHNLRNSEVHLLDDETWCATYDSEKVTTVN